MSTSTSSNRIIDLPQKKKNNNHLLKSSSASIVQKTNYNNYLDKLSSFKNKTRNKNKNLNSKISPTETENNNYKYNFTFNISNNISINKNIANNISFKVINHSSKNSNNNNKFLKTIYQRKNIGEIIKVNTNSNSKNNNSKISPNQKIFNSQKINKLSKKCFENKAKVNGKSKLLKLKQIGTTVNSVRHTIKLNKEKQKINLEFENELYKNNITDNSKNEKKTTRCLSSKSISKKENIYLNNLNISSSNSVKDLYNLEKKDNDKVTTSYNNCTTTVQNEILYSDRDLEGPEIIHFSVVELIQKGNRKMEDIAN